MNINLYESFYYTDTFNSYYANTHQGRECHVGVQFRRTPCTASVDRHCIFVPPCTLKSIQEALAPRMFHKRYSIQVPVNSQGTDMMACIYVFKFYVLMISI